jgi:hypothetical protein
LGDRVDAGFTADDLRAALLRAPRGLAVRRVAVRLREDAALRLLDRTPALAVAGRRFAALRLAALRAVFARRDDPVELRRAPDFGVAARPPERRACGRPVFRFAIPPPRLP